MSVCGAFVARGMAVGARGAAEQPATTSSARATATRGAWLTAAPSGMLAQPETADLATVHLVRSVGGAQRPRVRPHEGQRELLAHAAAAVRLHGPAANLRGHARHPDLDLGHGRLGA